MSEPVPWEYVEYVLCRHVFYCTPAVLRTIDPQDILNALTIIEVEAEIRNLHAGL